MNERRKIEERLRRKDEEIQELEEKIREARIYSQALQDVLKLFPRATSHQSPVGGTLRSGSAVAQARDLILARNQPVHISEILEALGKQATRNNRASLSGSLAAYVRRGEVFTRPAPNTFGLVELGHQPSPTEADEPPEGFGQMPPTVDLKPAETGDRAVSEADEDGRDASLN